MKTITLLILMLTVGIIGNKRKTMISSNYDCSSTINNGRCTGSAYCSACKNCSRCAHCSNGGSCGVCSGSSSNDYYSKTKKKAYEINYYKSTPKSRTYYKDEKIIISKEKINLRELPSSKSKIIEVLNNGQTVTFIQDVGDWYQVKVERTGTIGYIYSKLLNY